MVTENGIQLNITSPLPSVAFLCGKGGGDYLALEKARAAGLVDYRTAAFVTVDDASPAFRRFRESDPAVPYLVAKNLRNDREHSFAEILKLLKSGGAEWVFLCGFGYLLPASIVQQFPDKIINTHHALLPDHPGLFKKEWLVEQGEARLGATVHIVDEGMDTGPVLCKADFPNFGMEQFERVLRYYRFVQDVLIVQAFRDHLWANDGDREAFFLDIHFEPSVEKRIIGFYSGAHGLAQ